MKKVLIPVTNHPTLGNTDQANGTFAPELTHVANVLNDNDIGFDIVSLKGGEAPLYGTDEEGDDVNRKVLSDASFKSKISNTIPVSEIDIDAYDAIFYPGGFGLLSDIATNEELGKLAAKHYEAGGVIAAVCHGPGALLPIQLSNGEALIANKAITGFTREEEVDAGTVNDVPFLMEEALARKAGKFIKIQPWNVHVVEDERLITGQNPQSAHEVGIALAKKLAQ